jgi:N-acetylmuramoyl-L-alanine amidase
VNIISVTYRWAHALVHRTGAPERIVWHHSAGTGTPQQIHAAHVAIGDSGIAYHYYVRKDGRIYRGRPEWAMGAHCLGHNDWLGVCAEGNYDVAREMPRAQLKALQWLHDDVHRRRPGIADIRHKDAPGNSTACPGRYYPFAQVKRGLPITTGQTIRVPVPTVKPKWWAKLRAWMKRAS